MPPRGPSVSKGQPAEAPPWGMGGAHPVDPLLSGSRPASNHPGEHLGLSRRDSVETARLLTGHSALLAGYRHRIGQQNNSTCPECRDKTETLGHLLNDCPARGSLRERVFGHRTVPCCMDDPTMKEALGDWTRLLELLKRLGRLWASPPPALWFVQRLTVLHFSSTAFIHTKWPFTLPQHGTISVVKSDKLCPQLLDVSRREEA